MVVHLSWILILLIPYSLVVISLTNHYWRERLKQRETPLLLEISKLKLKKISEPEQPLLHPAIRLAEQAREADKPLFDTLDWWLAKNLEGLNWNAICVPRDEFCSTLRKNHAPFKHCGSKSIIEDTARWAKTRGYSFEECTSLFNLPPKVPAIRISGWNEVAEQLRKNTPKDPKEKILEDLDAELLAAANGKTVITSVSINPLELPLCQQDTHQIVVDTRQHSALPLQNG